MRHNNFMGFPCNRSSNPCNVALRSPKAVLPSMRNRGVALFDIMAVLPTFARECIRERVGRIWDLWWFIRGPIRCLLEDANVGRLERQYLQRGEM